MKRDVLRLSSLFALALGISSQAMAGLDSPPPVQLLGMSFNHSTIIHCAIVAVGIYCILWLVTRFFSAEKPGMAQTVLEMLISAFHGLCKQSIGPKRGQWYLPYIGTLFIFLWCCNMLSLIPVPTFFIGGEPFTDYNQNGIYDNGEPFIDVNGDGVQNPGFLIGKFEEPASDLNVPTALTIIFITCLGQGSGIRYHGIKGYLKSFFSPGGIIGVCMFPLNIMGKIAEHVSITFRIFGNIFGGAIIMSVVCGLIHYMILPIGMFGYFGVFAGSIQAFVFSMLALTYISMEAAEGE